ncbi:hypothetical protein, partial [Caballeronia terrestris]|uniref:hypothetical protein n=1 Tax=Caballeronia terrestris TaxID=1226301 RepID=UPI001F3D69D0
MSPPISMGIRLLYLPRVKLKHRQALAQALALGRLPSYAESVEFSPRTHEVIQNCLPKDYECIS